jgi:alkylhydroperoxidase/carboxymuconolactone decarboxylase family protein YurZ
LGQKTWVRSAIGRCALMRASASSAPIPSARQWRQCRCSWLGSRHARSEGRRPVTHHANIPAIADPKEDIIHDHDHDQEQQALATAERLLGQALVLPLAPGEPASGADFRRLATVHTFGDSWTRTALDDRSRALVSVAIAAALGTHEPLRGQLRIALNSGVTKDEIVDLFIHLEAYAGAARAFDSYQIAMEVFAGSDAQR